MGQLYAIDFKALRRFDSFSIWLNRTGTLATGSDKHHGVGQENAILLKQKIDYLLPPTGVTTND
jgi:hypothetical protein